MRRFILDTVVDRDGSLEELKEHDDLTRASPRDMKSLVKIQKWGCNALGHININDNSHYNPRFCDFVIMDESFLRSLATPPDETPHIGLVSSTERRVGSFLDLNFATFRLNVLH